MLLGHRLAAISKESFVLVEGSWKKKTLAKTAKIVSAYVIAILYPSPK
jgi:hypothetical protein